MLSGFAKSGVTLAVAGGAPPAAIATSTLVQSKVRSTASGPQVSLSASVLTTKTHQVVSAGRVRFSVLSTSPIGLGATGLNHLGQARIQTHKLQQEGSYLVQAQFIPSGSLYAGSAGTITIDVSPPQVTSLKISTVHFFGAPGTPLTFAVTALDRQNHPVTDYTGTITLSSPTDHAANFPTKSYTFTAANQGTYTFDDGVTFDKGGAERLKVAQVNNTRIKGLATFGIE
jgi:hypothetical protein